MDRQVVSLVLGRLGLALVTILIVSFVVFAATAMLPGDVAQILLGQAATEEAVAGLRAAMHLDDPAILRFLRWLAGLVQGNLGTSYANNMPVAELIGDRLANTLTLAAVTTMVAVPVALFLGITTAMYRGRLYDLVVNTPQSRCWSSRSGCGGCRRSPSRATSPGFSTCSAPTPCRSSRWPSSSRRR